MPPLAAAPGTRKARDSRLLPPGLPWEIPRPCNKGADDSRRYPLVAPEDDTAAGRDDSQYLRRWLRRKPEPGEDPRARSAGIASSGKIAVCARRRARVLRCLLS